MGPAWTTQGELTVRIVRSKGLVRTWKSQKRWEIPPDQMLIIQLLDAYQDDLEGWLQVSENGG